MIGVLHCESMRCNGDRFWSSLTGVLVNLRLLQHIYAQIITLIRRKTTIRFAWANFQPSNPTYALCGQ